MRFLRVVDSRLIAIPCRVILLAVTYLLMVLMLMSGLHSCFTRLDDARRPHPPARRVVVQP